MCVCIRTYACVHVSLAYVYVSTVFYLLKLYNTVHTAKLLPTSYTWHLISRLEAGRCEIGGCSVECGPAYDVDRSSGILLTLLLVRPTRARRA